MLIMAIQTSTVQARLCVRMHICYIIETPFGVSIKVFILLGTVCYLEVFISVFDVI